MKKIIVPKNLEQIAELFERARRQFSQIELELGSNNGKFLSGRASRFPDRLLIGLDIDEALCDLARKNAAEQSNVEIVHAEGLDFIRNYVPTAGLDAIHIYFPTPDPADAGLVAPSGELITNPLLDADFVAAARRVMKMGGSLRLVTDDKPYYRECRQLFSVDDWLAVPWERPEAGQGKKREIGSSSEQKFFVERKARGDLPSHAVLHRLQVLRQVGHNR